MTTASASTRPGRGLVFAITAAYLGFIAWLTLGPQPTNPTSRGFFDAVIDFVNRYAPSLNFNYNDLQFLGNIAIFVPIGFLFVAIVGRRRWWLAVLIGVAMTLAIEGTQEFLPTRVPDVQDLIANSAGAAIGVLFAIAASFARGPRRRDHSRS